jgi:hypothetical protein
LLRPDRLESGLDSSLRQLHLKLRSAGKRKRSHRELPEDYYRFGAVQARMQMRRGNEPQR